MSVTAGYGKIYLVINICGTVDFSTPVNAILPDQMKGPYDIIFLMTKQLHNPEVVTMLKPMLANIRFFEEFYK